MVLGTGDFWFGQRKVGHVLEIKWRGKVVVTWNSEIYKKVVGGKTGMGKSPLKGLEG